MMPRYVWHPNCKVMKKGALLACILERFIKVEGTVKLRFALVFPALVLLLTTIALAQRSDVPNRTDEGSQSAATVNHGRGTYLWIGRFEKEERAQMAAKKVEDLGLPVVILPKRSPSGDFFVVFSGPFDEKKIVSVQQSLAAQGFVNVRPISLTGANGKLPHGSREVQARDSNVQTAGLSSASAGDAQPELSFKLLRPHCYCKVKDGYVTAPLFQYEKVKVAGNLYDTNAGGYWMRLSIRNDGSTPLSFKIADITGHGDDAGKLVALTKAETYRMSRVSHPVDLSPEVYKKLLADYWLSAIISPGTTEEHGLMLLCAHQCVMPFTIQLKIDPRHQYEFFFDEDGPSDIMPQIVAALRPVKKEFCQSHFCDVEFARAIRYHRVVLSADGQKGVIVEVDLPRLCGSGGCATYVLKQSGAGLREVLDAGASNFLEVKLAKTTTHGLYDLIQLGGPELGDFRFQWTGSEYVPAVSVPKMMEEARKRDEEKQAELARQEAGPRPASALPSKAKTVVSILSGRARITLSCPLRRRAENFALAECYGPTPMRETFFGFRGAANGFFFQEGALIANLKYFNQETGLIPTQMTRVGLIATRPLVVMRMREYGEKIKDNDTSFFVVEASYVKDGTVYTVFYVARFLPGTLSKVRNQIRDDHLSLKFKSLEWFAPH